MIAPVKRPCSRSACGSCACRTRSRRPFVIRPAGRRLRRWRADRCPGTLSRRGRCRVGEGRLFAGHVLRPPPAPAPPTPARDRKAAVVLGDIADGKDVRIGRPHPAVHRDSHTDVQAGRFGSWAFGMIPAVTRQSSASSVVPSSSSTPVTRSSAWTRCASVSSEELDAEVLEHLPYERAACSSSCRLSGQRPRSSTRTRTSSCAMLYAASSPSSPAPTITAVRQRVRRMYCWIWTASSIVRRTKLPSRRNLRAPGRTAARPSR